MYADDICLIALTASAMQYLLDVCYDYDIEHNILFNPIKSVRTIFRPNSNKILLPTVFIGSDALKYVSDTIYLGFSYCDSKSDDNDMLRQTRSLYAKSYKLLCTFCYCSTNVKLTYSKAIVPHCIAHFYRIVIKSMRLIKFVLRTIMCIE